jgi:hypothetical protein
MLEADSSEPLSRDTTERFEFCYDSKQDLGAIKRVFETVSGLELSFLDEGHAVTLGAGRPRVFLRHPGTRYMSAFRTDWTPLDVLRLADEDGYLVDGERLLSADLPLARTAFDMYARRLAFLPAPAAREMMRRIRDGRLTNGSINVDLLDSVSGKVREGEASPRVCARCGQPVVHGAYDQTLSERICLSCTRALTDLMLATRTSADPLALLASVAETFGRVPTDRWRWEVEAVEDDPTYVRLVELGLNIPAAPWFVERYGSWFRALVAAGILPDGTQKMVFGYRTLAADGHMCRSLGEKTLDDWLYHNGVEHECEPHYPNSALRADFAVNGRFIEYFGLAGDPDYDTKSEHKRQIARQANITLVEILPADLAAWGTLQDGFAARLGFRLKPRKS